MWGDEVGRFNILKKSNLSYSGGNMAKLVGSL
jgi:hypothetical protein